MRDADTRPPFENSVFVANAFAGTVNVIDARADTLIGPPIRVGRFPRGIAFSGTAVWVADSDDHNVDRIVDGQVIKTIPVGRQPVGVAVGDNAVWVANNGDNTVSRIDLGQGDKVKIIRVGKAPFAIAFGLGWRGSPTAATTPSCGSTLPPESPSEAQSRSVGIQRVSL